MGVEPFLVASSVNLVLAQRLARVICDGCREPAEIPAPALVELGMSPEDAANVTCFRGMGCGQCGGSGYRGRLALYEVMPVSEELRDQILAGGSANDIKRAATEVGMITLRQAGLTKLKDGLTTMEEILRVTMPD
jgi:type IV pilus assembly protein PilB